MYILEETMTTNLVIVVVLMLFGGGGYYGAAYPFGSGPSRDGTQRNEIA